MQAGFRRPSTTPASGVLHTDMESSSPPSTLSVSQKQHVKLTRIRGIRAATQTGMARLSLSDDDARVRRWFAEQIQELGCSLTVDQMGNMFARQAGSLRSLEPMTAMGSHLDTQPRGGRYDGILGIVAALEVLRTMKDNGFKTQFDVGIVNWTKYVIST